jgi:hypothetical protein
MSKAAVELDSGEKIPAIDFAGLTDRDAMTRGNRRPHARSVRGPTKPALFPPITAGEHLAARRRETTRSGYQD